MKVGAGPALLLALPAALLAGCGGEPAPAPARLAGPLSAEAQQARLQACNARLVHYRQLGVVKHGGAAPGVDRAAWDSLPGAEQAELFEVAACIASAGAVAEQVVTIAQEGGGPEIETRRVSNDRDFAGGI